MPGPDQWTKVVSHALLLIVTRSLPNCAPAIANDEDSVNLGSEAMSPLFISRQSTSKRVAIWIEVV